MADAQSKEQQHPLYSSDRQVITALLSAEPTDFNLAELARLRIRYQGFPGAKDIQSDIETVLKNWKLTEDTLFEKTRQLHTINPVYRQRGNQQQEDWS